MSNWQQEVIIKMHLTRVGLEKYPAFAKDSVPRRRPQLRLNEKRSLGARCQTKIPSRSVTDAHRDSDPLSRLQDRSDTAPPTAGALLDQNWEERDLDSAWDLIVQLVPSAKETNDEETDLLKHQMKQFLERCLEMQRSDLVFAFLRRCPKDVQWFAIAAKRFLKSQRFKEVCEVMELRNELGMPLDAYAYNAYLSALGRLGLHEDAKTVFEEAIETQNDSIQVYNAALDAFARTGDARQAEIVWRRITDAGLAPNSISYVGIMRAWSSGGHFDKVRQFFREMLDKGLKPMPHAYTVLFDCAARTKAKIDAEWLVTVVRSMPTEDVAINGHILSAMVNAFSGQDLNTDQIQFVFDTVSEFRRQMTPGNTVYATLLKFCCRRGMPNRAIDIWAMIKDDGITPNGHVYSSLLKAFSSVRTYRIQFKLIREVSKRLTSHWEEIQDKLSSQSQMRVAFNALLHFYAETKNVEAASSIYQSMQRNGPSPDLITFNTVLSAYVEADVLSRALAVLEDMDKIRCAWDGNTYSILLHACSKAQEVDRAIGLLEEMKESGLQPTIECYSALIDTCIKEGSPTSIERAFEYFHALKEQNLRPTAVTYGCMFLAYEALGDVDGAFKLYKDACDLGVSPSDRCHNVLIGMCTEAGRLEDALDLIKVLVRKHGDIAEDTMNSIIRALSASYLPRSLVLLRMMDHRAMIPSLATYSCLVIACCRDAEIQQAFALYKEMISRKLPVNQKVGSALITSLSNAGEVLAALRVTNGMFEKAGLPSIDSSSINKQTKKAQAPKPSRRKERIVSSALPTFLSLGALTICLTQRNDINLAMYVFRQTYVLDKGSGIKILAKHLSPLFDLLIQQCCSKNRVDWAIEVFLKWTVAIEEIERGTSPSNDPSSETPRISLAVLAFLHATCKRTPNYESYIWRISEAMQSHDPSPDGRSHEQDQRGTLNWLS